MSIQTEIVPGPVYMNGEDVLRRMAPEATRLDVAVAFVSWAGAEKVSSLLEINEELKINLVARGAPITEPEALLHLNHSENVEISVVIGPLAQRYHPKLWIVDFPDGKGVLSGSGNLTQGGLSDNAEQFDYLRLSSDESELISRHELRFERLTEGAQSLAALAGTKYWERWLALSNEVDSGDAQSKELEELAKTLGTEAAKKSLYQDLIGLYERSRDEVGYTATYFRRYLIQEYEAGNVIPYVARIVRRPTEGFGRLAEAGRPDLMVEQLVLDATKPYHHLFTQATRDAAQANLDLLDNR